MAVQLKHAKTVAKSDGLDTTVVQPSDWNASHTLTAAAGSVLGAAPGTTTVTDLPFQVDTSGNISISGTIAISGNKGTAGQVLTSNGASLQPSWGTLGVAGGGTGATTLTGLVKGNGTSAFTAAVAGTDYVAPSALASYALLSGPTFTGVPKAPTATVGTNTTQIATTAFVQAAAGGVTLLGTINTTSGSSQSLSVSLSGYKFLKLVFNGVSHNSGSSQWLTVNTVQATMGAGSSTLSKGIVEIDLATGNGTSIVDAGGAATARVMDTTINTSTTSITIGVSGGSFDAGSVLVYGVK